MENKKRFFSCVMFLTMFILLISLISSIEFTTHESYDQKETLIAKISGNFVDPVLEENIAFYRYYDGSEVYTPLEFELLRVKGNYYMYTQLEKEKSEGNYSVKIEDVRYYLGGDITDKTIQRNFTISNKTADFSVEPGVVKTETDFKIKVTNLYSESTTININPENQSEEYFLFGSSESDTKTSERQITLDPGEIQEVDFELSNKTGLKTIIMSSDFTTYKIPVYSIIKNDSVSENKTIKKSSNVYFSYEKLNLTGENSVLIGNKIQKLFTITNSLEKQVENISLKLSPDIKDYVNLTEDHVSKLEARKTKEIGMKILSNEIKNVKGNLTLEYESGGINYSSVMELRLSFINETQPIQNETNQTQNQTGPVYSKTCAEEGGQKCNESSVCADQQIEAKDGTCCLGKCKLKGKDNKGKIIGWVIVIVVVLFLVWFYLVRYKGIKSKINILEKAREKGKKK